jgi:hypothetical protein
MTSRKFTTQEFIYKAKQVHGDKYNYTNTVYVGTDDKLTIECIFHGDFHQTAQSHLQGRGCRQCAIELKGKARTQTAKQTFIERANKIHNNFYNYEKFVYEKSNIKSTIICPIHGEYVQTASAHLIGQGCRECGLVKNSANKIEAGRKLFEDKARKIHGDYYDYSETSYAGAKGKALIICRKHGKFVQTISDHLSGCGCSKCGRERTIEASIENPTGWTLSDWVKTSETSRDFEGFRIYLLYLSGDNENFYKIGRTFTRLKVRTRNMPYEVTLIHEIRNENPKIIFDLENELKRKYRSFKYIPDLIFAGRRECFSLDLPISDIITNYPTNYTPKIDDAPTPTP